MKTMIINKINNSKMFVLRAIIFLVNCQSESELLNGTWAKNECGLSIKDDRFFQSILFYVNRNSQNKNRNYLLTGKQWDILQNTTKLSKYHRQIAIFINSKNPNMDQLRTAINYHVAGSDDLPSFKAR